MSVVHYCDLCRAECAGGPPLWPDVTHLSTLVKIDVGMFGGFNNKNNRLLDVCQTCQVKLLRLMADKLEAEAGE